MNYSKVFIKIRIEKGWSQSELAEKIGLSQRTVSAVELNKFNPSRKSRAIIDPFLVEHGFAPPPSEPKDITDNDLKFALFGSLDVDDAVLDDVKEIAKMQLELYKKKRGKQSDGHRKPK
jgi:transcriptional regulator with XRE-family HTH domain